MLSVEEAVGFALLTPVRRPLTVVAKISPLSGKRILKKERNKSRISRRDRIKIIVLTVFLFDVGWLFDGSFIVFPHNSPTPKRLTTSVTAINVTTARGNELVTGQCFG